MRCPKSRFPIGIIVIDELELIIFGTTWDSVDSGDSLLVQVQVRDGNRISKLL